MCSVGRRAGCAVVNKVRCVAYGVYCVVIVLSVRVLYRVWSANQNMLFSV